MYPTSKSLGGRKLKFLQNEQVNDCIELFYFLRNNLKIKRIRSCRVVVTSMRSYNKKIQRLYWKRHAFDGKWPFHKI